MSNTIKIKNSKIMALLSSLKSLDGLRVSKDETKFFDFDEKTALRIALNQVALEPLSDAITRTQKQWMREAGLQEGAEITKENADAVTKFRAKCVELMELDQDIQLSMIPVSVLLKKKVPPSVIAGLHPIIEYDSKYEV